MNTIEDIIASGKDITLSIKAADLKTFGKTLIDEARKQAVAELRGSILLSVTDVTNMLKISRATLHRMDTANTLKPIQFYGDNRYRLSDIEEFLAKRNNS